MVLAPTASSALKPWLNSCCEDAACTGVNKYLPTVGVLPVATLAESVAVSLDVTFVELNKLACPNCFVSNCKATSNVDNCVTASFSDCSPLLRFVRIVLGCDATVMS